MDSSVKRRESQYYKTGKVRVMWSGMQGHIGWNIYAKGNIAPSICGEPEIAGQSLVVPQRGSRNDLPPYRSRWQKQWQPGTGGYRVKSRIDGTWIQDSVSWGFLTCLHPVKRPRAVLPAISDEMERSENQRTFERTFLTCWGSRNTVKEEDTPQIWKGSECSVSNF